MTIPAPVRLPCNELHVTSWQNKTVRLSAVAPKLELRCFWPEELICMSQHQEKRGDIVASLRLLIESVKAVRVSEQPRCSAPLLLRLENNINNYLLIVSHLQLSVSRTGTKKTWTFFWPTHKWNQSWGQLVWYHRGDFKTNHSLDGNLQITPTGALPFTFLQLILLHY